MYVYTYICIYVHSTYIHSTDLVCVTQYICKDVYIYICMNLYMFICKYVQGSDLVCVTQYICRYVNMYICMCIYVNMYMALTWCAYLTNNGS